ncbi:A disintegrin and metalloproteinase with thrombospondin motifs 7 [Neoarius graeffei]|uniref:A disintegrin and metalloproteinase with thrombospondin motifs 7 n=1 Tax=Neoarius graeffei TaxID=443677 RepID=UPI00298CD45E|nr:A disintegrin and metalloproteinase with thrombospondin motifs 7 [Neoarius graeffei]XP_060763670.1 A disintegrin and metalloproteinase with thrombospondin motifs 7 [Neoarius graeffei]
MMPLQLGKALLLLLFLHSSVSDFYFPDTHQEHSVRSHGDFTIVHPEKVDGDGRFISHTLSHHFVSSRRRRREVDMRNSQRVYYKLNFSGWDLTLNLTINDNLLASGYVFEQRMKNRSESERVVHRENECHLIGTVTDGDVEGTAAFSSCNGLTGMLSLPTGVFLVEPVRGHTSTLTHPQQPHVLYHNPVWLSVRSRRSAHTQRDVHTACGVKDSPEHSKQIEDERELWEREQRGPGRVLRRRSVSTERWVETMVVADSKMVQYHGNNNVESYIFTVMNMVAGIYHDASIGNAIHIVLVRLILLQSEEKGLKIVHHADSTLTSFCSWQKNLNPQSDTHPVHHDIAVLITRKDICAGKNQPCETLGLSHLSGMCQPHRSCNINEDSGLPVAFTIAHELGHSFGIQHDGQGNDCEPAGHTPFIMSRQLQYDSSPLTWSICSKQYITHFLDRGWGFCLDDRPSKKDMTTALLAPGVKYTRQHQCQMQYGPNATLCPETDNVCQILWCSVDGSCRSKLDAPIDGTRCGPGKWCISGECVVVGKLPETVNGGWGQWSTWSHCSRTCSSGVQSADRECDKPKPAFGGKYCTGERKRYRICNTVPCVKKKPSFRDMQCSEFDTVPYHNQLYQWIPISTHPHPCELQCQPVNEDFSERMLDAVTDGTPCFSNSSRNVCINGVCKEVGCDHAINSNAEEDRCGVCLGDGSSCETLNGIYTQREGYGYTDMVLIPEGARDIVIQEVEEAANFLAMRAAHSDKYYLNGNYIIQWNGEYQVGGAKFYYERSGNLENLTSPGPTKEPIVVQLLFQETNPGVRYEFVVKKNSSVENDLLEPQYRWKYGVWTDCSATCGQGEQQQPVRCFRAGVGVVDEELCDPNTRPDDRRRHCKNMDCPARWWVGGWQSCSASCGSDGIRKRTVLCVRTVAGEERVLHPGDCRKLPKPKAAVICNRNVTCGSAWAVGNWSECSLTCGGGVKSRSVKCVMEPQILCDAVTRPRSTTFCNLQSCYRTRPRPLTPTPGHDPDDLMIMSNATPNTPSVRTSHTPTPSVLHEDDQDFILVNNSSVEDDTHTGEDEAEEGSTDLQQPPDTSPYTPGYDYITDDDRQDMFTVHTPVNTIHTPQTTTHTLQHTTAKPPRTRTITHTSAATAKPRTTKAPAHTVTHRRPSKNSHTHKQKILKVHVRSHSPTQTHPVMKKNKHAPRNPSRSTVTKTGSGENTVAFWVVGNWSECSASCGLGAVWRSVVCSSGQDSDCSSTGKPEPAQHCKLQPCAVWRKCVEGCVSGMKYRNVQCVDSQSRRVLRPFHCSDQPSPPTLQWKHTHWGQCSKSCGGGVMERSVFCPEPERCNASLRPESSAPCNLEPCVSWVTEPWQQCSESCGGGVQKRVIRCVSEGSLEEVKSSLCLKNDKPESLRVCGEEECRPERVCKRDSMSTRFCSRLKLLGRCVLNSIRKQCCLTCVM